MNADQNLNQARNDLYRLLRNEQAKRAAIRAAIWQVEDCRYRRAAAIVAGLK